MRPGRRFLAGTMIDFLTADPNLECLDNEAALDWYYLTSYPAHDYVIARQSYGDCAHASFVFMAPAP